ncbi:hypothetical protein [Desulfoferula mesophila]|uniref:Uncharacterized protein n=1 Tax=Desulfoferula mesophila TaxID=3058419 RepID=A0AAU9EHI1_9BACT|nr:hypothetical protein FAK_36590 [Desulfoferula mesophilus]
MKAIHIVAIIAISFIAGMFGGTFSERVFANPKAEAKIHEQIIARGFFLVDENKKTRAGMSFDPTGQPVIYVKDKNGAVRAYMACEKGGPLVALNNSREEMSAYMEADGDGSCSMGLMGAKEKARLTIVYKPNKGPMLGMFDENNISKAFMMVARGKPSISLLQDDKKPAITMLWGPNRGALLGFWNSRNEAKAGFGLMNDKPLLFAYRPDDTGLLFNIQRDGRPALGLLTEGRPEWSATGTVPQMPALDGILDQVLR